MTSSTSNVPAHGIRVPAAKIQFLPEDRAWIAERIQEVLATGQLTLGKYGTEFEKKFSQFCGVGHAVAVSSGTSSLEIILRSIGVEGDRLVASSCCSSIIFSPLHLAPLWA